MGQVIILPETTKQPITTIGKMAGVCWGADTSDPAKNYRRGWDCIESGHGRTFEFPDVYMELDGYSARVIREWYTHIGGMPTRLQASTRYIDYGEFEYVTPSSIAKDNDTRECYQDCMAMIAQDIEWMIKQGIPREDAALLLPLGMTTRIVCKHNLRNLIDMSRQRLCNRAYWEFRDLFRDVSLALAEYGEEWARIVNTQFYPKCEPFGLCPEKHGCGKFPCKMPKYEANPGREHG
jgi:thymidylate synthase (FAD)